MTFVTVAMGRVAAGRYLRILLEERNLSVPIAADKVGVSPKTLGRWLSGEVAAPVDGFLELVALVDGSLEQIDRLLRDKQAKPVDGIRAAAEWLGRDPHTRLAELAGQIESREELDALISAWERLHPTSSEDAARGPPA